MLVSIQFPSNRPRQFTELIDNLEETLDDTASAEIIVKVDSEDVSMIDCVEALAADRSIRIIPYIATGAGGHFNLWRDQNQLLELGDPSSYFVQNINDEVRYRTKGWDAVLKGYVGTFADHIFRLRCSDHRRWSYEDFLDIGPHPENTAFFTRKWFEVSGNWCDAHSPDAFQQGVACHLESYVSGRDVVIDDISLSGLEANLLIDDDAALSRKMDQVWEAWDRLYGLDIQENMRARAARLYAHILAIEQGSEAPSIDTSHSDRRVIACDTDGTVLADVKFKVSARRVARLLFRFRHRIWRQTGRIGWLARAYVGFVCQGLAMMRRSPE